MSKINVLDVTLRDGGIVNDFRFGEENMKKILLALESSGVKQIELGYLEKNTGTERGRSQYINEKVIEKYVLTEKKPGITYLAMMDYGKFDVDALGDRTPGGIDAIRLAFHKRNYHEAIPLYRKIIDKGYEAHMQPMVTLHYSDDELKELIDAANEMDIKGLYFVDTFGQMQQPDIRRFASLLDERLRSDIALGFHAHNNIQMAYANALTFLQMPMERNIMLDSSIMGMGRGAGNLNTELILSHLNQYYDGQYNIPPLLNVMDGVLETIRAQYPWGYSAVYYLSSVNDCSPIYAGHYYKKHMLPVEKLNELLSMIKGEKRISFDKNYAEEMYRQYNGKEPYDDKDAVEELRNIFQGKAVCIIAPGKSLNKERGNVQKALNSADVTISLNCDIFNSDYELVTRNASLESAIEAGKKIIAPSSVTREKRENIAILDYYKWITVWDETHDSSGFIALNLLTQLGAKTIYLVGFDGFSVDIDQNYYDESLRKPVSWEQIRETNRAFRDFIRKKREQSESRIIFATNSIYDQTDPVNIVFDLDGVLINSINVQKSAYYGSYKEVVGDDNCPPFSEYIKHTGDSLPNIFRKMGLPEEMVGPYRRISSDAIDQIIVNEEAINLIREMKTKGIKCGICTGKDRKRTIDILRYFKVKDLFDAVICSDDVTEPKPSAMPVLRAIEEMGNGVTVDNTIVVGDGYYDILSAKNAGCKVVLTLWYGDEGVSREADYTSTTVQDLKDWIEYNMIQETN